MAATLAPAVALAVALAAALAGCGAHARTGQSRPTPPAASKTTTARAPGLSGVTHGPLTVTPSVAHAAGVVSFGFVAPAQSGLDRNQDVTYSLSVGGPPRPGCVATRTQNLAGVRRGEAVHVTVGPAQLGGRWCEGRFTARVYELQRPACSGAQMCPQFIRIVATFGPATFRIEA